MRAVVTSRYGGPEVLVQTELPDPEPAIGEVLIRVKAFRLRLTTGIWPRTLSGGPWTTSWT